MAASLTAWKAVYSSSPHFQAWSFFNQVVRGATILALLIIELAINCIKLRKECNFFLVVGWGHSINFFYLLELMVKPS